MQHESLFLCPQILAYLLWLKTIVLYVTGDNFLIFLHWPHRLLDRDQVDGDESVEDEEEDEFLKGFKVSRFYFHYSLQA